MTLLYSMVGNALLGLATNALRRTIGQSFARRLKAVMRPNLEKALRDILFGVDKAVQDSGVKTGRYALDVARLLSEGPFTTARLRQMGHPYRTIRPNPPADPAIVNRQSGEFLVGWRIANPRGVFGRYRAELVNDAPHARLLFEGTFYMIRRPILERINEYVDSKAPQIFRDQLRSELRRRISR